MKTAPPFPDRQGAGGSLAAKLAALSPPPTVVAAIPRGGVIVAAASAALLGVPLALVHARKLTAPPQPEIAFGAVDEDGHMVVDYPLIAALRLSDADVEAIKARVSADIRRQRELYAARPLADFLPAESAVLVDDGLATGLTMDAAVAYARRHGAQEVIVAAPCASSRAAARLRGSADRFVSLVVDADFEAVGDYYAQFGEVDDSEILALLSRLGRRTM